MRVGVSRVSPRDLPPRASTGAFRSACSTSSTLRTREKPLEWTAGGGQAQDHVAGLDGGFIEDLFLVHHAHREAGQVVLVDGIEPGHLGGLPADEGGAGLDAALGHAGDDLSDLFRHVLAAGDIVQEEQGAWPPRR